MVESLHETFRVGREVGVPVVISHHKVVGKRNHGRSEETLPTHPQADGIAAGRAWTAIPYSAGSTVLSADRAATASRVIVSWSKAHAAVRGT